MGRHRTAPKVTVEPRSTFGEEYWAVLIDDERRVGVFDRDSRDPDHRGKVDADAYAEELQSEIDARWAELHPRRAAADATTAPAAVSASPS